MGKKEEYSSERFKILELIYNNATKELQQARTLMEKILFGIVGILIVLIGWLFNNVTDFSISYKILLTLLISSVFYISMYFSKIQNDYFRDLSKVIHKIDTIFEVFKDDIFIENDKLYPLKWENFGSKKWKEPIFRISFIASWFFYLISIIVLWLQLN